MSPHNRVLQGFGGRPAGTLWRNTILQQSIFHLDPRAFDSEIVSHGTEGKLRHGLICPCQRIESGYARINCPSCRGVGWIYPDEMVCETYMLASGRGGNTVPQAAGMTVDGQMMALALSSAVIGRGDLWRPCGEVHVVQQIIHRAQQQVDTNMVREVIRRQSHTDTVKIPKPRVEKLLYPEVQSIDWLYYENEDGVATPAREGVDYNLVGNEVRWLTGAGPLPGKGYSCRYRAPAAYLVENAVPRWREEGGQKMPWSVTLRRLDRVQDADLMQKQQELG